MDMIQIETMANGRYRVFSKITREQIAICVTMDDARRAGADFVAARKAVLYI